MQRNSYVNCINYVPVSQMQIIKQNDMQLSHFTSLIDKQITIRIVCN